MTTWTTRDELEFLYGLAIQPRTRALSGWINSATNYYRDWGQVTSKAAISYAQIALAVASSARQEARRNLPMPARWLESWRR